MTPGRAVFYLLLGLLILSRGELLDIVVGGVVLANSILLLISAKRITRVFNEFRSAKYTEGGWGAVAVAMAVTAKGAVAVWLFCGCCCLAVAMAVTVDVCLCAFLRHRHRIFSSTSLSCLYLSFSVSCHLAPPIYAAHSVLPNHPNPFNPTLPPHSHLPTLLHATPHHSTPLQVTSWPVSTSSIPTTAAA